MINDGNFECSHIVEFALTSALSQLKLLSRFAGARSAIRHWLVQVLNAFILMHDAHPSELAAQLRVLREAKCAVRG
jgi:hypothetical protein